MSSRHTIVLMQPEGRKATRTFMDYETVEAAVEESRPTQKNITYDIASLFKYLDSIHDLSCLVYTHSINAYVPYNKEWIKNRIMNHLQKMAQ
ncbi:enhancer of rudimentary family protein [Cavenderia fasciculata]|uniref:Enhancer of rudimentary family protein n=1 Tax=Cavenderia fasciculata TaxID=261658 RepID=F4Q1M9_CACFS|nr:enhancer of rudimentary family protein [Cavenderia fasciculata]EGG18730.1 enhancer of rudimentary family protein [Cavenderia fasciculata]|eukprot:XP_004366634.1 enhancer of rudimentary family protein [Cavenderia fasciculata]